MPRYRKLFRGKPLGSIGHLDVSPFMRQKIFIAEKGMLAVNDNRFIDRAEITGKRN